MLGLPRCLRCEPTNPHPPSALQDNRLTVTRTLSANGATPLLHFQYQLSERRQWCWETSLSPDGLFLEIPGGPLPEGSKEGYACLGVGAYGALVDLSVCPALRLALGMCSLHSLCVAMWGLSTVSCKSKPLFLCPLQAHQSAGVC